MGVARFHGRPLNPGSGRGPAVVEEALSFYGEVDPRTGRTVTGKELAGRVLVLGRPRGSTVGSYTLYGLKYYSRKPLAIIVESEADPILVAGAILGEIPLYDRVEGILGVVGDGAIVSFNEEGEIAVSILEEEGDS